MKHKIKFIYCWILSAPEEEIKIPIPEKYSGQNGVFRMFEDLNITLASYDDAYTGSQRLAQIYINYHKLNE